MTSGERVVVSMFIESRACFICGEHSWCHHREPEIELAYLREWQNVDLVRRAMKEAERCQ